MNFLNCTCLVGNDDVTIWRADWKLVAVTLSEFIFAFVLCWSQTYLHFAWWVTPWTLTSSGCAISMLWIHSRMAWSAQLHHLLVFLQLCCCYAWGSCWQPCLISCCEGFWGEQFLCYSAFLMNLYWNLEAFILVFVSANSTK